MARLFVAEKPSLGRAIAAALPKPHKNHDGYVQAANGDAVTWCIGHLLEQAEPDAYDEKYKVWRLDDLPILPEPWILKPRKSAAKQLSVVKKLLRQFDDIIHAGDPDREGQLLVDEVFSYAKLADKKKQRIQRLLINDLNVSAVKKALSAMRSNLDFVPLSVSALARSRADWLYGMNMSRAYTLLGKQAGYQGVLSVGRVQTPVLGLVVRRDREIAAFMPKPFYQLDAVIPYQGSDILARWQPSESCQPWQDEEGRVLSRKLVENVAQRIVNQPATVVVSERKGTKQAPPLPYSLSALQIDAAKRFTMSAVDVLACCQSLYEKHKVITYPRSDSRYLPKDHLKEASTVTAAIGNTVSSLSDAVKNANLSLKSKAWNDSKVEAHHAIIPTGKSSNALSGRERDVYELIARQYLMQFYPAAEYVEAKLDFDIAGGIFIAKGKQLTLPGWRALLTRDNAAQKGDIESQVPPLNKGTVLTCARGEIKDCMTEPPRHFTEATLLQAMTGIARFVKEASLKKILRNTDGLGTEATRAGILELLFKRRLLSREGKQIRATASACGLIDALPEKAAYPDMTAHWERQLQDMAEKKGAYQPFMSALESELLDLMNAVRKGPLPESLRSLPSQPNPFKKKRGNGGAGRKRYKTKA
ncbi:DNA topoisomerase III [Enterovibrio norvegicus FF-162]|uniref:DNA topoisomerase III n=1 Tax=Enterovibrio norvegicus TaxID=188144 RepID=UPI0002DACF43|nr:DNA topoisomerase III [Enterovibrio norvegicus]OEE85166.1 DNA topoisomerase III [Enterovibrio norvegicus FF-162]